MIRPTRFCWKKTALASAIALSIASRTPYALSSENEPKNINIQTQPLSEALITLSRRFGVSILGDEKLIQNKTASMTDGSYTLENALNSVLNGTGLTATLSKGGGYLISGQLNQLAGPQLDSSKPKDIDTADVERITVVGSFQQSVIDRIPISVQELPFTLDTYDRDQIDLRNFTNPADALALLPNIDLGVDTWNLGFQTLTVRGYVADVLVNNRLQNIWGARDDSFVERYEILKGPASITLGPTNPGGVINTVTKSPKMQRFYGYELSTDQFDTIEIEIDANTGALDEAGKIRSRFSGAYRDIDYAADPESRRQLAFRPVLEIDLTDKTRLQTSVSVLSSDGRPNLGFPLLSNGDTPPGLDADSFLGADNSLADGNDTFYETQLAHDFLDSLKLVVRGSYQKSTLNYRNFNGFYNYTYDDGVPGIGIDNQIVYGYAGEGLFESENNFLDAQLSFDMDVWGQRQDIVFGVSYTDNKFNLFNGISSGNYGPIPVSDLGEPIRISDFDLGEPAPFTFGNERELVSAFAEFVVRPSDWLSVVGGLRYDEADQSASFFGSPTSSLKQDDITFRLGVSAEIRQGINLYLSVAESFVPQDGLTFELEPMPVAVGISYEIGAKGRAFNNTLKFQAALFSTTREDIAVRDLENSTPGIDTFFTTIGEQRNEGFELSANWQMTDAVTVDINYGYLDVEFIEGSDVIGFVENPPDQNANILISYTFDEASLSGLTLGAGVRYVGERESAQSPGFSFPDFTVFDAYASLPLGEMTLSLNAFNISDELYLENAGAGTGLVTGGNVFGAPRTFRFSVRGSF